MAEEIVVDYKLSTTVEHDQQMFVGQEDATTCTNDAGGNGGSNHTDENLVQVEMVQDEGVFAIAIVNNDEENREIEAACNVIIQQQQNNDVVNEVVIIGSSQDPLEEVQEQQDPTIVDPFEKLEADSWQEMSEMIEKFCNRTATRFVTISYKGMKESLADINFKEPHKVYWQDVVDNHGLAHEEPFIMVGRSNLQCQFGNDQNATKNRIRRKNQELNGKLKGPRPSKKCGCPATAYLKRTIRFPGFKIEVTKSTVRKKKHASKELKEKLKKDPQSMEMKEFFTSVFPPLSDHRFHEKIISCVEPVCKEVAFKIQELALQNNSFNTIMREIDRYVTKELFYQRPLPEKNRRRYYPRNDDVRKIARQARDAATLLPSQLARLQSHFENLSQTYPGNTALFQIDDLPFEQAMLKEPTNTTVTSAQSEEEEEEVGESETFSNAKDNNKKTTRNKRIPKLQKLVFFYQSPMQQILLNRYGSTVYITEVQPTEPGSRAFTVSMYLLVVRTNVDHQVVGTVLVEKYSKGEGLKEALLKCKEVNSSWAPKYFMVDKEESLLLSLRESFPESVYYYTKSSCNRLWRRYLSQQSNGLVGHCDELLTYLNAMRISTSKEELTNAASALEQSQIWQQSPLLRTWFQTEWLPIAEKWVRDYLPPDLSCFVDEDCSLDYLHLYQDALLKTTLKTVEGATVRLVETLTTTLAEKSYQSYVAKNRELYKACKRLQIENPSWEIEFGIPYYLYSQAAPIVENLDSVGSVIAQIDQGYIEITVDAVSKEQHIVSFGSNTIFPACTCGEWKRQALPCWHMFTVFKNFPHMKYDSMSVLYRLNPVFGVDYSCLDVRDLLKTKLTRNVSVQASMSTLEEETHNKNIRNPINNGVAQNMKISANGSVRFMRNSKYSKLIAGLKAIPVQKQHIRKRRKEEKIVRIVDGATATASTANDIDEDKVVSLRKRSYQGNMNLRGKLVSKTKRGWVATGTSGKGSGFKVPRLRTVKVKSIADVLAEMPSDVVDHIKKTLHRHKQLQLSPAKKDELPKDNDTNLPTRIETHIDLIENSPGSVNVFSDNLLNELNKNNELGTQGTCNDTQSNDEERQNFIKTEIEGLHESCSNTQPPNEYSNMMNLTHYTSTSSQSTNSHDQDQRNHIILQLLQDDQEASSSLNDQLNNDHNNAMSTREDQNDGQQQEDQHVDLTIATKRKLDDSEDNEGSSRDQSSAKKIK